MRKLMILDLRILIFVLLLYYFCMCNNPKHIYYGIKYR